MFFPTTQANQITSPIVDQYGFAMGPSQASQMSNAPQQSTAMGQLSGHHNNMPAVVTRLNTNLQWNSGYKSVEVMAFHIQACDRWEDIRQRSLTFDADPYYIGRAKEIINRNQHTFNPINMGQAAMGLVGMSNATGVIPVENGWGERRYRYVAILRMTPVATENYYELMTIAGYSEYFDPSYNHGSVDTNLPFVISLIQRMSVRTASGQPFRLNDLSKLVGAVDTAQGFMGESSHMLRPVDVAVQFDANAVLQEVQREYGGNTHFHGSSNSQVGFVPEKIGFGCDNISHWFSTLATGMAGAHSSRRVDAYTGAGDSGESVGRVAEQLMRGPEGELALTARDPFLQMLTNALNSPTTVSKFTLEQLRLLDRNVMQKLNTHLLTSNCLLQGNGNYDDPNENGPAQRIAYTLAMGVGVLLVNHGCMMAKFTWRTGDEVILTDIAPSLPDHDISPMMPAFKNALLYELLSPAVTDQSTLQQAHVIISVSAELVGLTVVDISYDGGARFIIPYPTYMGNRLSANVSNRDHAQQFYTHAMHASEQLFGDN